jgi:predicted RNA-binding protein with PUA-like domain
MAYWLLKTEPEEYSWDDQVKRGAKGEAWTGVRNFTARRHLKEMKKGDKFFFYHTGDEKQVVGKHSMIRALQKTSRGLRCKLSPTGRCQSP